MRKPTQHTIAGYIAVGSDNAEKERRRFDESQAILDANRTIKTYLNGDKTVSATDAKKAQAIITRHLRALEREQRQRARLLGISLNGSSR